MNHTNTTITRSHRPRAVLDVCHCCRWRTEHGQWEIYRVTMCMNHKRAEPVWARWSMYWMRVQIQGHGDAAFYPVILDSGQLILQSWSTSSNNKALSLWTGLYRLCLHDTTVMTVGHWNDQVVNWISGEWLLTSSSGNTHPFNGPLSRITQVSRYQKDKTNLDFTEQQQTVSGSGISWAMCKSAPRSRQITTPAPQHSVFYRSDALPAAQPTASKHWRQWKHILFSDDFTFSD